MLNLKQFKRFDLESATNQTVRGYWEKQKSKQFLKAAGSLVFLTYVALELSAPGASLIDTLREEVASHSSLLSALSDNIKWFASFLGLTDIALGPVLKMCAKGGALFLLVLFFAKLMLVSKDPFRNHELLRYIPYKGHRRFIQFYLREIKFYARYLPSNKIAEICHQCTEKEECPRRVDIYGAAKTQTWCELFSLLPPKDADLWLRLSQRCRSAYYRKYGVLLTIFVALLALGTITILNAYVLPNPLSQKPLLYYLVLLIFAFAFFCWIYRLKEGAGGIWREYREKASGYLQSERFQEFLRLNLCGQVVTRDDVRSILTMIHHLNFLVEDKLLSHCCGKYDRGHRNQANLRRILQYLKALYYVLNHKKPNFRTAFFLLSEDRKYLYPFIVDDSQGSRFHSTSDPSLLHEICSRFFDVNGKSVAAIAFRSETPKCRNSDIDTVDSSLTNTIKSILCVPMFFHPEVYENLRARHVDLPQKFGVLCIDCDDEQVFSQRNYTLNKHLIEPFVHRLVYELSLGLFYENGQEE